MQKLKPDLIEYISILKKDVKINNYDTISRWDNKIKLIEIVKKMYGLKHMDALRILQIRKL